MAAQQAPDKLVHICETCPHLSDHPNAGCRVFRSRALACRLGVCRVHDRSWWLQLATHGGAR